MQNATYKMLNASYYNMLLLHATTPYFCVLSLPTKIQRPDMPRTGLKVGGGGCYNPF